ncbi:MAG: CARDB domain-containing protein [Acidobacteriota bacterium]
MNKLKAVILAGVAAAFLVAAGSAGAASATSTLDMQPSGKLYKEVTTSGSLVLDVKVKPDPVATTLKPIVSLDLGFADYMTYEPHNNVTPVCTAITEEDTNYPTEEAIARCPNSIVGSGTSDLFLAQNVGALITDSVTVNFNGGRDNKGRPIQIVHGYSAQTNTGIYIRAVQKNNALIMDIPRLTADSAVPAFISRIPGEMGQDPDYLQIACPGKGWTSSAVVTIANRDTVGEISGRENLDTPPYTQPCSGKAGKAKFGSVDVKAKGKVKANKKGKFEVTVKNNGIATARNVKLTAKGAGKGSAKVKNIAPGKSRTFNLKAKVKGRKGKKATVKVKVTAKKTSARTGKTKVRLG